MGPYVSQFLLKGNQDKRKPVELGREADDGYVSYGSRVIHQRQIPAAANIDYLTSFSTWLIAQNGLDLRGTDTLRHDVPLHPQPARRRHLRAL